MSNRAVVSLPSGQAAARSHSRQAVDDARDRARLRVVPRARVQSTELPFVILVSAILVGGVILLLMFNTSMQAASFTQSRLEKQQANLSARQQALEMQLQDLRDPQNVAEAARAQGMVIPMSVAMLSLPTGTVVGSPAPAVGDYTPPLWVRAQKPNFG